MAFPDAQRLYDVIDGTWPAAMKTQVGPWTIRLDKSGSSRVGSATIAAPVCDNDIEIAAKTMIDAGQRPLFMLRKDEDALDGWLEHRGYQIKDPVNMYAADAKDIATQRPPPVTTFEVWPPLAVQLECWAAGGIGPGRIAVMDRATSPKTSLMGRLNDRPAGTAFVGVDGDCAMIHALEVHKDHRRQGLARYLTQAAAYWTLKNGANYLTLVTTRDNTGANALYSSLGMTLVGQYHYRILPE